MIRKRGRNVSEKAKKKISVETHPLPFFQEVPNLKPNTKKVITESFMSTQGWLKWKFTSPTSPSPSLFSKIKAIKD